MQKFEVFAIELLNIHSFNREKVLAIFDEKNEIRERCKGVHCVDLGESFPTRIYLQKNGVDTAENEPLEVWGENSFQYSLYSLVLGVRWTVFAGHFHFRFGFVSGHFHSRFVFVFLTDTSRRSKIELEPNTGVTFEDVTGCDEAKLELVEVVDFLKKGEVQQGGRQGPPRRLAGRSPGTGKTLLVRAIAEEAGVPFTSASGSEFVEMFVGVGASRVRDLFKQAKDNAPCITKKGLTLSQIGFSSNYPARVESDELDARVRWCGLDTRYR